MTVAWLFLLVSLVGAWFTYNVYRPHENQPVLAVFSFFAGWLAGELAVLHVGWQVLCTVGFVVAGALSAWPGILGLGITLVSWAALAVHHRAGWQCDEVFRTTLRQGLGEDYESSIPENLSEGFVDSVGWESILMPHRVQHPAVERIRGLRYARVAGRDLELDVYRPADRPRDCPVLFQIHGGGWMIGYKEEQGMPLMYHLAQRGWMCVNVDYRLSPGATFPDHLIDLKRALAWVRANAEQYGGNPDFVAVTGGSAGGHLCALMGLTANDPEYQPGFEEVDTRVDACVPFYGIYDFADRRGLWPNQGLSELLETHVMKGSVAEIPEAYDRASPVARVHAEAPPFLVVHGDRDTLVPVASARAFAEDLRGVSHEPVLYAEVGGAQHAFEIFPSLRTALAVGGVSRFLTYVYARYLAGRVASEGRADTAQLRDAQAGDEAA